MRHKFLVSSLEKIELKLCMCAILFSNSSNQQSMGKVGKCTISLKPETAYNLIHTILFGFLALSTMRYFCLISLIFFYTILYLTQFSNMIWKLTIISINNYDSHKNVLVYCLQYKILFLTSVS